MTFAPTLTPNAQQILINQLLANQQQALIKNPSIASTTTKNFVFPLIRAQYPQLLASQLVGVQPMSGTNAVLWKSLFSETEELIIRKLFGKHTSLQLTGRDFHFYCGRDYCIFGSLEGATMTLEATHRADLHKSAKASYSYPGYKIIADLMTIDSIDRIKAWEKMIKLLPGTKMGGVCVPAMQTL